jgi:8-oxo-dGTP pyrophosphatase MutT (NUDIX family)
MILTDLGKSLRQRLALPLPGQEAQFKMAHVERRMNITRYKMPDDHRKSAVIIILYPSGDQIKFPLIIRPVYDGVHSGQVSLPGGRFEDEDENLQATAIREAYEETGVDPKELKIIGELTELYIPPSNFLVHPFVAIHESKPVFVPHEREVARIVEVDIEKIMDEGFISEKKITLSNGMSIVTPCFDIDALTIWGATAMILSEFKSVLWEIGF